MWYTTTGSNGEWMLGTLSDLAEEKYTWGFAQTNQVTPCPTDADTWEEWYNQEWKDNIQAVTECAGM